MGNSIIKIEKLNYSYEDSKQLALSDINLEIKQGYWTAIVGQNGSGKSTLTKLLNGILNTEKGTIIVDNITLDNYTVWNIRKLIGIVFQNPDNQFVGATVGDDVAFGMENQSIPIDEMRQRVVESLKRVDMLEYIDRDPQSLSGGQKQRVAIAGIIAVKPKIIILDEATSMLDPSGRHEIINTIMKLKDELKLTVISITHDVEEVLLADDVVVLNKGKILRQNIPEDIFSDDELLKKAGLKLPFVQDLQKRLINSGIKISNEWVDEKGLIDKLWKYHLNK